MNRNQILEELQSWKAGSKSCVDYWPPRYNKYDETDHALLDEVARVTGHHSVWWRGVEKHESILRDAIERCDRTGAGLVFYVTLDKYEATPEIFQRKWQAVEDQMPIVRPPITGVVVDYEVPYLPNDFEQNRDINRFNVVMYDITQGFTDDAPYTRYGHGGISWNANRWQDGLYSRIGSDPCDTGWSIGLYDTTDHPAMETVLTKVVEQADRFGVYEGSVWLMAGLRKRREGEPPSPGAMDMSTMPYDTLWSLQAGEMFGGNPWYRKRTPDDPNRDLVWAWTQRVNAIHLFPGPADYGSSWEHLYALLSGVRR